MTRSAKGTAGDPGSNIRAKAALNRGIHNTGWAEFRAMLGYKAANLVEVPAAHTSQRCHVCGAVDGRSRRSQASFVCLACSHAANADVNAARNILASGIGATARGGALALAIPAIREVSARAA